MENTVIVLPLVKMLGVEEYKMFLFKITLTLTRPEIFFFKKSNKKEGISFRLSGGHICECSSNKEQHFNQMFSTLTLSLVCNHRECLPVASVSSRIYIGVSRERDGTIVIILLIIYNY